MRSLSDLAVGVSGAARPRGRILSAGALCVATLLLSVGFGSACSDSTSGPVGDGGDGGAHDGATDASEAGAGAGDAGADAGDAGADAEMPIVPGPSTWIATTGEIITERLCDHDGDGTVDNGLADLGTPHGDILASALSSRLARAVAEDHRIIAHFPWLDDAVTPHDEEADLIIFKGRDLDVPETTDDDFSGHEPFEVETESIDDCGEPVYSIPSTQVDAGVVSGSGGTFPVPFREFLTCHGAGVAGTLSPRDERARLRFCAYFEVADVGPMAGITGGEATVLEELVAGAPGMGIPGVPGIQPDLDFDGDGLERFVLDEDYFLESCIDGDSTVIYGRDCWQDTRIADAFSIVARFELVPAVFAGRPYGPSEYACPEGPPEPSLWDPLPEGSP